MHWTPLLALLLALPVLASPTLFTYMSPESEHDPRSTYDRELLRLALERPAPAMATTGCRPRPHDPGPDVGQPALQ